MFGLQPGPFVKQYLCVIVANFTIFQVGLSVSWLSPTLVKVSNEDQMALSRRMTTEEGAWLVSMNILTGIFVIPFTGFLANYLGRKSSILIFCVPRVISCVLLVFAKETWILLLARALTGLSDLSHVSVTATYSSEIASKEIRGALGTISQILSCLGGMIMLTVGPFVSFQSLNIIYIALVIGTTLPILFIPETPYYLYSQGRTSESIKTLTNLRQSESIIHEELLEYSTREEHKIAIKELYTDRVVFKTIVKVVILTMATMMTGYNSISFYLQTVFDSTHTNLKSEVSSLIIGCIQIFACSCTVLLTDRVGRKPIFAVTMTGLTVGMMGLGTFFKLTEDNKKITGFLNYLPLISIALVIYCYNAGLGSILWTLVAEHFDGRFRAIGISIAVFTYAISGFVTIKFFPNLVLAVGPAITYYIFSGFCVFIGVFIMVFFNETKGKAFSQIQLELGRNT